MLNEFGRSIGGFLYRLVDIESSLSVYPADYWNGFLSSIRQSRNRLSADIAVVAIERNVLPSTARRSS